MIHDYLGLTVDGRVPSGATRNSLPRLALYVWTIPFHLNNYKLLFD